MNAAPSLKSLLLVGVALLISACSPSCFLKPTTAYEPTKASTAPDYTTEEAWAALPDRQDNADLTPPDHDNRQQQAAADVFFLHPTTWFSREEWNDPLTSKKSRELVDEIIMSGQASAFNECCRIFAPRYRQATLGAYFGEVGDAQKAFTVAYEDVERAFETFLEAHNEKRPFILAGHSQGSMHAMRLLEQIDADEELRQRLIAAYIPGFSHPMKRYESSYEHLEPCTSPTQTGCIVAWDTYREEANATGGDLLVYWSDATLEQAPQGPRQCTNPITWQADTQPSSKKQHLGAVEIRNQGNPVSFFKLMMFDDPLGIDAEGLEEPRQGLISARCDGQVLRVPDLDDLDYSAVETQPGNYHMLDYELFYMDIRANAVARTDAWLEDISRK
jgi:hypothetical protein